MNNKVGPTIKFDFWRGKKFGRLTALDNGFFDKNGFFFLGFECDCGEKEFRRTDTIVNSKNLNIQCSACFRKRKRNPPKIKKATKKLLKMFAACSTI